MNDPEGIVSSQMISVGYWVGGGAVYMEFILHRFRRVDEFVCSSSRPEGNAGDSFRGLIRGWITSIFLKGFLGCIT